MSATSKYPTTDDPAPAYLSKATPDELARMVVGLTEELWVLRDRVMVLEQVLTETGSLKPESVDEHTPGTDLNERLHRERQRLIQRVLGAPLSVER
ncbi:hypothetical protein [Kineosporia babensis]|uniref:Uncharacterized protein n=1 Tax=Kineosporia babensis TaxID=499548 RepID=A0A9X1NFB6_9ACTN|nr:hypothetical protein [Kineosporia babensis]MCD5313957.1 hypothetical protein [Kineosporia babensis]